MAGSLPPSLLEKLKAFDSGAAEKTLTRAEEIQSEQIRKELTNQDSFKEGVFVLFRPAALKTLFQGLVSPFGSAQNYRDTMKLSTPEDSWENVWSYWRQAINEYMEQNDFSRDTLDAEESTWLNESARAPSAKSAPRARI